MDSRKWVEKGWFPKKLKKRKNTYEVGEGLEQWRKLIKDVRLQKTMHGSTRQLGVVVTGVVIIHVLTKPQRHQSWKQK